MKNENEGEKEIGKASSSTSEVIESVDLTTVRSQTLLPKPSNAVMAGNIVAEILNVANSGQHFTGTQSQPNLRVLSRRNAVEGLVNSTNAMHNESVVKNKTILPSYSTVLKLGPPITFFDSRTYPSIPFITRQPPPSYAEVHGGWDDDPSVMSADSFSLGPDPLYISCPRCRTIVVSNVQTERSNLSYVASLVLCVCLCWPCCLIPCCLKSCRNSYHFCPICHYHLGVYRPC